MEFLTNILSGGILGVFTSAIGTWFKYKQTQEDNKFKLSMLKAQSDASIAEINAQVQVQRVITEGAVELEENKADTAESVGRNSLIEHLTGKYLSDNILKIMVQDDSMIGKIFRPFIYLHLLLMDAIRGLIRPILTIGIVWYVTNIINLSLGQYLMQSNNNVELMTLVIHPSIQLILFSTSTVIAFWFADKSMARRFQKGSSK